MRPWSVFAVILVLRAVSALAQDVSPPFRDCEECPDLVAVPAGSAVLGSEPWEADRKGGEGPIRSVTIAQPFALGRTEITVAQFRAFMADSGHVVADAGCNTWGPDRIIGFVKVHRWDNPGYAQREDHPVVCVSYDDAAAYAAWLSEKTGQPYRLPSSTEFEYATRAGTRGPWFWGTSNEDACTYANVADATHRRHSSRAPVFNCDDGWERTAPVGSFASNPWGLADMLGNAWEWTADCFHEDMADIPTDGRAWLAEDGGDCDRRTPRGGSWVSGTDWVRAAAQARDGATYHSQLLGFRVARDVTDRAR